MRNTKWLSRMLTLLLVATLLTVGAAPFAPAQDEKSVKDKVALLEKQLKELEAVVKALSIELQKLTQAGTGEIENIRPRLFAVEQLSKDLSFDLKKMGGRVSVVQSSVEKLSELPQQVLDLRYSVGEMASRMKANELAIGQLRDQLEKLAGLQALVVNLQGTVGMLSNRMDATEKGLAGLTERVGRLHALEPITKGLQETTANLSVRVGRIEEMLVRHTQHLEQMQSLPGAVVQLQTTVSDIANRTSNLEARLSRLQDITAQLQTLQPVVAALQEMVSKLAGRIDAGEARTAELGKTSDELTGRITRLSEAISQIVVEVQATRVRLNEVQERVARITGQPVGEMPDVKALVDQAVKERVQNLAAQLAQAKKDAAEAKAAAEGANSLALIGLVAGLAGILIGFLF